MSNATSRSSSSYRNARGVIPKSSYKYHYNEKQDMKQSLTCSETVISGGAMGGTPHLNGDNGQPLFGRP